MARWTTMCAECWTSFEQQREQAGDQAEIEGRQQPAARKQDRLQNARKVRHRISVAFRNATERRRPAKPRRRNRRMPVRRSRSAGDAGAARPAITVRILGEILLVIILGEIERRRGFDFGGDRTMAISVSVARRWLRNLSLPSNRVARREDRRIDIGCRYRCPTACPGSWVVILPEGLQGRAWEIFAGS